MGQFTFCGIWYFHVPECNWLSPHGSNYALYEYAQGNPQDPANCYNVYSTPTPGAYIFQSQLNGMYLGVPPGTGLVCASVADPAESQPLIPVPYQRPNFSVTFMYLPDKVRMLASRDDETGWNWLSDEGGNWRENAAGLQPTSWNFSDLLAGKGTGGFTLKNADLSDYVFPAGSNFTDINFSDAIFDGAKLDQCNLTRANFTSCMLKNASLENAIFVDTVFNQAHLIGAKLRGVTWTNVKANGALLDGADFTGATLTNIQMAGALMYKGILIFSNVTLNGGDFSDCDFQTLYYFGTKLVSTQSQPISFNRSRLNYYMIKNNWQWMSLLGATIDQLPQVLSSASNPLNATGAKLSGLNQNNLRGTTLEHAVFDYALLDKMDLSGANLNNASLIQASLHGATLTDVKLQDANLSGAQLGSLGQLFTLPTSFETDLNAGPNVDAALRAQFSQHSITLSSTASLETLAAGRVWELNDVGNHVVYTIRLETQILTVYAPAPAASLVNAYMPNAVLTGANLYNVLANGIQFYGSKAAIDGSAILEEAQLNNSNLSNLNLTQAQLLGTNLSGSYLLNAKFNKASLTPSAGGKATDLSDANLQGADFTDAQLSGANLANAAVAIKIPTKANPDQGGVYLFSLPYSGDPNTAQQYIAELSAAANQFSLNPKGDAATLQKFVTALESNQLNTLKAPFIVHHIMLSNDAQIQTIDVGSVWQIVDGQNSYRLWTDIDEQGNTELYAAPSLPSTRAGFQQNNITLRWQASAAIDTAGQQWLLDNDSENPQNFSLGYVRFVIVLRGGVLDVYGTALRIERLGDKNQLQIDTETCNVTKLALTNMNGDTVCPNGAKLSTNQNSSGVQWDTKWLRASTPPRPPSCVPTDYSYCPPSQSKAKHQ